jgi:hypothetical protein
MSLVSKPADSADTGDMRVDIFRTVRFTNSVEQSPSIKADSRSRCEKLVAFYGNRVKGSLPCSQKPATYSYFDQMTRVHILECSLLIRLVLLLSYYNRKSRFIHPKELSND